MKAGWITRTLVGVAMGALALTLIPATAYAQTRTTQFDVTATVARNCRISATTLAFGAYDPVIANATVPLDANSTITVACTRGAVGVWVGLDVGTNPAGTVRRMSDGGGPASYLTYEIYREAGRTNVWGNIVADGVAWGPFPTFAPITQDVYGRVAAGQDVPPAGYADRITATVNF
jgi:spore coat protein U-like protein